MGRDGGEMEVGAVGILSAVTYIPQLQGTRGKKRSYDMKIPVHVSK